MKIASLVSFTILALIPLQHVFAQNNTPGVAADEQVASAREMVQNAQKDIIRSELRLTDKEAAGFWPVYEDYRAAVMPLQDNYVSLVGRYMQHYENATLNEENAAEMLDSYFDNRRDMLKQRQRFIKKFRAVLPMIKVARFYQLENKFNADVENQLSLLVPLASE